MRLFTVLALTRINVFQISTESLLKMSDDFKEAFDSFFHDAGFKFLRLLMQMKKALLKSGNPSNILSDSETNFK